MDPLPAGAPDISIEAKDFAALTNPPSDASTEAGASPAIPPNESANNPRVPSLRSVGDQPGTAPMSSSSTHLGMLQNARRPAPGLLNTRQSSSAGGTGLEAKMKAFHLSRQGTPPQRPQFGTSITTGSTPSPPALGGPLAGKAPVGGLPAGLQLPPNMRPVAHNFNSAPVVPKMPAKGGGLSARRGMKLPGGLPGSPSPTTPVNGAAAAPPAKPETGFTNFAKYVDTENGVLNFDGQATIDGKGIKFHGGQNIDISLDEVDTLDELGKGNYGTVYKVRHARPRMRRPGMGLAGNKMSSMSVSSTPASEAETPESSPKGDTTGIVMAMKEIRLELDDAKFRQIIMELEILHKCLSPYIIDFYGAFFQEGAVYICIEFMDGGSIDKIYGDGIPENILRKITYCTTQGLRTLKDDHNIIHRDVKPTNILMNTKGQIKICDFGVSGNLVASIAKTNIGCQSYMAPERISGGGMSTANANPGGTYSVQSDIWSLGLTIIECAMGRYPYPPETYNNIFSQLSVSFNPILLWALLTRTGYR
jgi:mitogen-activated protein kinase kinase